MSQTRSISLPSLWLVALLTLGHLAANRDLYAQVGFSSDPSGAKENSQPSEAVIAARAATRKRLAEFKANGMTLPNGMVFWQADKWMQDAAYYKKLSTPALADEVLAARTTVANEMGKHDHIEDAIVVLEELHPGFKELENRDDAADGFLHVYDTLRSRLNPNSDLSTIRQTSIIFDQLHLLYETPAFKDKIKGKEQAFLKKNLEVVDTYRTFITQFSAEKLGSTVPFFREPYQVAKAAILFAQIIDPAKFAQVEPELKNVKWPKEQRLVDLKSYLDLVSDRLHPIATDGR